MSDLLSILLALEDRLLRGEFETLLHADFLEFGQSGRRWTKASLIATLSDRTAATAVRKQVELRALAPDTVLLTYLTTPADAQACWRSSVWQRLDDGAWQLRFHQATPSSVP